MQTPLQKTREGAFLMPSCLSWIPFKEGSGNDVEDLTGKMTLNKAGSTFTVAHTIANTWANNDVVDQDFAWPVLGDRDFMMLLSGQVLLADTFFGMSIGQAAGTSPNTPGWQLNGNVANVAVHDGSTSEAQQIAMAAINANDWATIALVFRNNLAQLEAYSNVNSGGTTLDGTLQIDEVTVTHKCLTSIRENAPSQVFALNGLAQNMLAAGVFMMKAAPASADLIEILDVTDANLMNGHKWFDPRLSKY